MYSTQFNYLVAFAYLSSDEQRNVPNRPMPLFYGGGIRRVFKLRISVERNEEEKEVFNNLGSIHLDRPLVDALLSCGRNCLVATGTQKMDLQCAHTHIYVNAIIHSTYLS